jgi:hypothetical protein
MIHFSVRPFPASGIGAQLQQFAFLYAIGHRLGLNYSHQPWENRRSPDSALERLGLDRALSVATIAQNAPGILIEISDETVLISPNFELILADTTLLDRARNIGTSVQLRFTTWQKSLRLKEFVFRDYSQIVSTIREKYQLHAFTLRQLRATTTCEDGDIGTIRVVIHLRFGDTAVLKVGDSYISCWQLRIDEAGNHNITVDRIPSRQASSFPSLETQCYLRTLEQILKFLSQKDSTRSIDITIVSDGYESSRSRLYSAMKTLSLNKADIDLAVNQAQTELMQFGRFGAVKFLIGEDPQSLMDASLSLMLADVVIHGWGSFARSIVEFFGKHGMGWPLMVNAADTWNSPAFRSQLAKSAFCHDLSTRALKN